MTSILVLPHPERGAPDIRPLRPDERIYKQLTRSDFANGLYRSRSSFLGVGLLSAVTNIFTLTGLALVLLMRARPLQPEALTNIACS